MRLLEVFKDFEVTVRGWSNKPQYTTRYRIVPREDFDPLTLEDLEDYIESLQKRFPDRGFYLRKYKNFRVITQKGSYHKKDAVPIYVDLKEQRFYVPSSYLRRNRCLVNYICMVTLGSLGITKREYMGRVYSSLGMWITVTVRIFKSWGWNMKTEISTEMID